MNYDWLETVSEIVLLSLALKNSEHCTPKLPTLLQTLPERITPLKGTPYLHASAYGRSPRPPNGLGMKT